MIRLQTLIAMLYKVHEQKICLLYTYITMLSIGKRHHTGTIKEVTSYHTVISRAETTHETYLNKSTMFDIHCLYTQSLSLPHYTGKQPGRWFCYANSA